MMSLTSIRRSFLGRLYLSPSAHLHCSVLGSQYIGDVHVVPPVDVRQVDGGAAALDVAGVVARAHVRERRLLRLQKQSEAVFGRGLLGGGRRGGHGGQTALGGEGGGQRRNGHSAFHYYIHF